MNIIQIPFEHKMFNEEFSGSLENFIYDEFALVYTLKSEMILGFTVLLNFNDGDISGTEIYLVRLRQKCLKYYLGAVLITREPSRRLTCLATLNKSLLKVLSAWKCYSRKNSRQQLHLTIITMIRTMERQPMNNWLSINLELDMADEIHALNKNEIQDIDYDTYFGEMDLSDEEKEDRKKLAEKFEKIFVMLFALLSGKEETEITTITKEFIIRYESIATQYCKAKRTPSYITDYARYIVNEVVDATTQNIEVEYFTSQKRAKNVAANEANAVGNYRLQTEMVKQGYKTKEWRSKEDSHVRPTHAYVDRKRIDIFKPFEVGNSLMMFPKDHSLGAQVKEIAGCRCSLKYYK